MPAKNWTDTHFPAENRNQSLFSLPFSLSENIKLLAPLGFKESLFLWKDAKVVLINRDRYLFNFHEGTDLKSVPVQEGK
jgi:hypothetical protein